MSEYHGEMPQEDQDRAWVINVSGNPQYFQFLIPDSAGHYVVVPYLHFQWNGLSSKIQATYDKDYKIYTRLL